MFFFTRKFWAQVAILEISRKLESWSPKPVKAWNLMSSIRDLKMWRKNETCQTCVFFLAVKSLKLRTRWDWINLESTLPHSLITTLHIGFFWSLLRFTENISKHHIIKSKKTRGNDNCLSICCACSAAKAESKTNFAVSCSSRVSPSCGYVSVSKTSPFVKHTS